jgi:hypothetical protein
MSSSDFSIFTKLRFVFREIYKPAFKINEKTAYIGSFLKIRFQSGFFNMMLRQFWPVPSGLDSGDLSTIGDFPTHIDQDVLKNFCIFNTY